MEPPECPVCLQSYDGTDTVPRVLPCGHSACESCLAALPSRPALPDTVRCPACNQTVRLPRPPGPAALPKNIDLLRFCSPQSPNPNPKPKPKPQPPSPPQEFPPLPWTEHLFDTWKDWILPPDALEKRRVSLEPVVAAAAPVESRWFRLSHTARVMEALSRLPEAARAELGSLVQAASRQRRGLSKVCGLWMDPAEETSPLFLVCERYDQELPRVLDVKEEIFMFGMVGMELCEAVMGLHSEGVVCGCLTPACFCLDEYGHCVLDLNSLVLTTRRVREDIRDAISGSRSGESRAFVSPEVFVSLSRVAGAASDCGYGSDVWSVACVLAVLLLGGDSHALELFESFTGFISKGESENLAELLLGLYEVWREKVVSRLEALLSGTQFDSLLQILASCLDYHIENRPQLHDIWHCIRLLIMKPCANDLPSLDILVAKESSLCCLILGNLGSPCKGADNFSQRQGNGSASDNASDAGSVGTSADRLQPEQVDGDLIKGLQGEGFRSITLHGHHDCITKLAVGGGFLFSSSYDKTVHVWSLQDFSLVQSLRGHEHKVMAIVVVDASQPLCISGDSGSSIFVWSIDTSLGQEPLRKWYDHNDWRYSGVHALAVSVTGYLYSGSGDKSIKAWSLKDYSLSCTMTGHRSTVSSLVVADGILYSGSWDGTIRLWCLNDHSPLSILEDDTPGSLHPVLSLTVDSHLLVSSYENGCLKLWRNDVLVRSVQSQNGAVFALHLDRKWLFTGGFNKIVNIQELSESELLVDTRPIASISCDSLITSLVYWHGKLFVGFSNSEIKVYYYGS